MKKIISIALATILVLSAVLTVPMVFADDTEPTTKIVNTFEEDGFGTKPNGTTSTLKNNALVASDTYIKSWTTAGSIVAQLEQVYKSSAEKAAGIKIYNPYDANFAAFVPEKNTTYKITFDYYYASKSADIELSIYGNTTDDGFKDTRLASAAYIGKNNSSITASTKNTATVYVNIGDTEYKSLSIVAELANASKDTEDYWGRIDNITLEKIDTSVIENTFEEGGFGKKESSTSSTLKNSALVASDTYIKSWATANSIVAEIQEVYKATAEKAAGVKIYNPYDVNFAAFVPEKNTTYKITFDYYFASKSADIELSIYGNTTDDGFKDTKLTSAAYIGNNNSSIIASTKNTATVYVNIGDTEYKSLSIVAELANASKDNADFWGRIDNIVLTKSEPECQHETKNDANVVAATYFKAGSKDIVCGDCGETVETNVVIEPTAKAFKENSYTATFNEAENSFTVAWTYTNELLTDLLNNKVYFNYKLGDNEVKTVPVSLDGDSASVTLEGFNYARLNEDLTYYLSAEIADVNTEKLVNETTKTVKVAEMVTEGGKLDTLLKEVANANGSEVVSGAVANTATLVSNTMNIDIANATIDLRFVASPELIAKLKEIEDANRKVILTVTIGDDFTKDIELEKLYKVTMVKISGLSYAQMYSNITVKLSFDYSDDTNNFATNTVTFTCGDTIKDADNALANALESYMTK